MRKELIVVLMLLTTVATTIIVAEPTIEKEIIYKPLSPMKGDDVFVIPEGSKIVHENGITSVYSGNKLISIYDDSKVEMIHVPSGKLVPVTHVHQVPSGSMLIEEDGIVKTYYKDNCILTVIDHDTVDDERISQFPTIPTYDGWVEWSQDLSVDELWQFDAYWTVPSSPPDPNDDAINFLFNGIQPDDADRIIQPVLEWNQLDSGRWTGRAWSVYSSSTYYYTTPINVDSGDSIKGIMAWDDDYDMWFIDFYDITKSQQKYLYCNFIDDTGLEIYCAFEGYDLDDDDDVPGDTNFHDMVFLDSDGSIDITWQGRVDSDADDDLTGLQVQIYNDARVKLHTAN